MNTVVMGVGDTSIHRVQASGATERAHNSLTLQKQKNIQHKASTVLELKQPGLGGPAS